MKNIIDRFNIVGNVLSCEPYGFGHINSTYKVKTDDPHKYILQKINSTIFSNIPALMSNIEAVTDHLKSKGFDSRHVLTIVRTLDDKAFLSHEDGTFWRMYEFVTDSICLNQSESPFDFYQSAKGFGTFQNLLADFDANVLVETIPLFHHTPNRYKNLHEAIAKDSFDRLKNVKNEVAFALEQEQYSGLMTDMLKNGELPLRVTHNDTKLNNVMLDAVSREALCVIDLDTVMPGLVANDFGDSIRFGATPAKEDEQDLSKVYLSLDLFDVYAKGFLETCGDNLTENEINTLPLGAKLMTLECGVRFLTDYLNGDVYFRTTMTHHNLYRARTQFKLVDDINKNMDVLNCIIKKYI